MRRKFTVYGLRFSKTTFWNRLNTGFLEPAVATALTACGIETGILCQITNFFSALQRRLPLAVLKRFAIPEIIFMIFVATALTACGIETRRCNDFAGGLTSVATALTACGIETM